MPEAPMYKDDLAETWEYEIWCSRQVSPVQPEAIAQSMSHTPDEHLWLGIFSPNEGHHCGPLLTCEHIHGFSQGVSEAYDTRPRSVIACRCNQLHEKLFTDSIKNRPVFAVIRRYGDLHSAVHIKIK